jgi:deazaflavin-dependent oxidoreductase (nitroreductase family)
MAWDRDAFENAMIEEMRTNGGAVITGPLAGQPLLILNSMGAKTGKERRAILTYSRDAGDYIVAGTAGGSKTTPAWVHNLEAHGDVTIEVATRVSDASTQVITSGAERDRLWDQHVAVLPNFAEYPAQTGRLVPMIRITAAAGD